MALTLPFIINLFIVQFFLGGHSWTTLKMLEKTLMIKLISKSQNCFYLGFLQIMMHQIQVIWKLPYYILDIKKFDVRLTSCCLVLKDLNFLIHTLTLLPATVVHARCNDNKMFVFFYYYCRCCLSPVIFCLVLFSIKWFYNQFLNAL